MEWVVGFTVGFALGLGAAFALRIIHKKTARDLAEDLRLSSEERFIANQDNIVEQLKASFGDLSLQALSRSTEEFLKLAGKRFDSQRNQTTQEVKSKKGLIDQQLGTMKQDLKKVGNLVRTIEKDREPKFGELTQ